MANTEQCIYTNINIWDKKLKFNNLEERLLINIYDKNNNLVKNWHLIVIIKDFALIANKLANNYIINKYKFKITKIMYFIITILFLEKILLFYNCKYSF